ncbi:hypothetical protein [Klebsiella michiganensis]|uniref:hypothetical protein n=1 Tax=Klebsiella michiganensis TaxID=1134687 RepID=UPI002FE5B1DA
MSNKASCVFCGRKPEKKSREHIIPQWLIKKTGDPKRQAFFGMPVCERDNDGVYTKINRPNFDNFEKKGRVFSFDSFTFPACEKCNGDYSSFEAKVKDVYERIFENKSINREQIDLFLDWMDKVRVGVWLGLRQLDKNIAEIEPNFAISSRMGCYDRVLMIKRFRNQPQGINFIGSETFAFAIMPSVFCLRINNLYFFNVSSMFLVSKGLGFPYIEGMKLDNNSDRLIVDPLPGTAEITQPIIDRNVWGDAVCIIQPMYKNSLVEKSTDSELSKLYETDYIKENSLEPNEGRGAIFIRQVDGSAKKMEVGDKLTIDFSKELKDPQHDSTRAYIEVLNWQNFLIKKQIKLTNFELLSEEQKAYVNDKYGFAQKTNDTLMQHAQNTLYKDMMLSW